MWKKNLIPPSLQDSTLSQSFSHKIKHFIDLTDNLIQLITGDKRKDDEKKRNKLTKKYLQSPISILLFSSF